MPAVLSFYYIVLRRGKKCSVFLPPFCCQKGKNAAIIIDNIVHDDMMITTERPTLSGSAGKKTRLYAIHAIPADMPWQSDRSGINLYIFSAGIFRSRRNSMEVIVMKKTAFFTARNIAYLRRASRARRRAAALCERRAHVRRHAEFQPDPHRAGGHLSSERPAAGLLGLASGVVTFITAAVMGREPVHRVSCFRQIPPVLTLVCIGKTTVAGAVAGTVVSARRQERAPWRRPMSPPWPCPS